MYVFSSVIAILFVQQLVEAAMWSVTAQGRLSCNGNPAENFVSFIITWSLFFTNFKKVTLWDKDEAANDPDDFIGEWQLFPTQK